MAAVQTAPTFHIPLNSKEEWKQALENKDKYVLVYAHEGGEVAPGAEEAAKRHAETTAAYKVDIAKFPTAKESLKLEEFPAVVVFKDGKEIKRVEGMNKEKAKEIEAVLV